jgi:hypothetical protein
LAGAGDFKTCVIAPPAKFLSAGAAGQASRLSSSHKSRSLMDDHIELQIRNGKRMCRMCDFGIQVESFWTRKNPKLLGLGFGLRTVF